MQPASTELIQRYQSRSRCSSGAYEAGMFFGIVKRTADFEAVFQSLAKPFHISIVREQTVSLYLQGVGGSAYGSFGSVLGAQFVDGFFKRNGDVETDVTVERQLSFSPDSR